MAAKSRDAEAYRDSPDLKSLGVYDLDHRRLGKGNFARVELATHRLLQVKVAIKIINVEQVKEEYVRRNLRRETKMLDRLQHKNIVRLYETMKTRRLYCFVMEHISGGDLSSLLKSQRHGRLRETRAQPYCAQIVSALHYMHSRGVVHRDLKVENIMLTSNREQIKIVDFGLSNKWSRGQPLRTNCGSPEYAAPELFDSHRAFGPEIDVWSVGVVFYVILVGRLPFVAAKAGRTGDATDDGKSGARRAAAAAAAAGGGGGGGADSTGRESQRRKQKLVDQIRLGLEERHVLQCRHLSADCFGLLNGLLEPEIRSRLTVAQICTHAWFDGFRLQAGSESDRPSERAHIVAIAATAKLFSLSQSEVESSVRRRAYNSVAGVYNILINKRAILPNSSNETHQAALSESVRPKLQSDQRREMSSGNHGDRILTVQTGSDREVVCHDTSMVPKYSHLQRHWQLGSVAKSPFSASQSLHQSQQSPLVRQPAASGACKRNSADDCGSQSSPQKVWQPVASNSDVSGSSRSGGPQLRLSYNKTQRRPADDELHTKFDRASDRIDIRDRDISVQQRVLEYNDQKTGETIGQNKLVRHAERISFTGDKSKASERNRYNTASRHRETIGSDQRSKILSAIPSQLPLRRSFEYRSGVTSATDGHGGHPRSQSSQYNSVRKYGQAGAETEAKSVSLHVNTQRSAAAASAAAAAAKSSRSECLNVSRSKMRPPLGPATKAPSDTLRHTDRSQKHTLRHSGNNQTVRTEKSRTADRTVHVYRDDKEPPRKQYVSSQNRPTGNESDLTSRGDTARKMATPPYRTHHRV